MRTKVVDHIDKVIEQSRRELDEESVTNTSMAFEQVISIHAANRHCDANNLPRHPKGTVLPSMISIQINRLAWTCPK